MHARKKLSPPERTRSVVFGPDRPVPARVDPEVVARFREHGSLLLRGFPDEGAFMAFTDAHGRRFSDYQGGGMRWGALDRESIGGNPTLLSVTGATQGFPMALHGEMYYLGTRPSILWFYCDTPPARGGQTTTCDGEALFRALDPATRRFLEEHRTLYRRRLSRSEWVTTYQTGSLDEVRRICAAHGTDVGVRSDGGIETRFVCSPLVRTASGRTAFVNSLLLVHSVEQAFESGWVRENLDQGGRPDSPIVVRLEDGGRLPAELLAEVAEVAESLTVEVPWSRGDVLMLDNRRVMHGRRAAPDPARRIYVRMAEPAFAA